MPEPHADRLLDCRRTLCPMPVVRTSQEMRTLAPGQVLKVLATDRGAIVDIPAWANDTGNELVDWHEDGQDLVFLIRKGEEA
ncbi:MAG TPA: sulfurtransferase TusA family protein [Acidimicrobiales bacterium]|nr:sulfurtransferase TusA family protein [Acidimicrobiales bacterium]